MSAERCTKPDGGRIECSWFTADHLELPNTVSDETVGFLNPIEGGEACGCSPIERTASVGKGPVAFCWDGAGPRFDGKLAAEDAGALHDENAAGGEPSTGVSDEEAREAADALVGPPLSGAVQDAYCGGGL